MMALKSCASAEAVSCSAVGAEGGRKPQRFILLSSCSALALSCARVNPDHAGEAYIKDETVLNQATSWMVEGGRPCERRTLSAYMNLVKMLPHPKIRADGDAEYSDGADT